eukprot:9383944-Alexandrium_andersonii.AAC.1
MPPPAFALSCRAVADARSPRVAHACTPTVRRGRFCFTCENLRVVGQSAGTMFNLRWCTVGQP